MKLAYLDYSFCAPHPIPGDSWNVAYAIKQRVLARILGAIALAGSSATIARNGLSYQVYTVSLRAALPRAIAQLLDSE